MAFNRIEKGGGTLRIALCDDETLSLYTLQELVQSFCEERKLETEIDLFSCGEDFLASTQEYDIVFMDIYLPGINGMETVARYDGSSRRQVVFTTTSREHAVEAFGLDAAHYLIKPLTAVGVTEAMERCLARLGKNTQKGLVVKIGQGTVSVPMEKIVYIEVLNKLCTIHTAKSEFQTYTSLDALFEQLDDSFLRVQRSYVVNMAFVESFLFDRVILQGGTEIMLSRNNRAELKKQYQRFLFDLARRNEP